MKNRFPSFKPAPETKNPKLVTANPTKHVEFKRKVFEFKAITMELKKAKFNNAISFSNPGNKPMFLFVEKMWWELSKALNGATITISVTDANGQFQPIYNSRKIPQLPKGIRNINLTYLIQDKAEVKISFECVGFDMSHPNYFVVYKWLDPLDGKRADEKVKPKTNNSKGIKK